MEQNQEGYFILGLLVAVLILAALIFLPYLSSIVLSATLAILFAPLYRKLVKIFGGRESISSFLSVIIIFLVVFIPLTLLGVRLFSEAFNLYASLSTGGSQTIFSNASAFQEFTAKLHIPISQMQIDQYVRSGLEWAFQRLGSVFSGVLNAFGFLFITLFGLYYFLRDGIKFRKSLEGLAPLSPVYSDEIFDKLYNMVNSVVKGTLVVAVAQGITMGIGFAIFRVPSPVLWGSVTIITTLIPIIGTAITAIPAILYLLLTGKIVLAVGLALWASFVVGLVDNFLRPYLVERGVNIHPLFILLSVLGGLEFFGPIGFLAGPLVLSLLFALLEIYSTTVLKKRGVPHAV
ncbi:MAG: AI-2E family transporter [Candidatus Liptonbacteria bacterium]